MQVQQFKTRIICRQHRIVCVAHAGRSLAVLAAMNCTPVAERRRLKMGVLLALDHPLALVAALRSGGRPHLLLVRHKLVRLLVLLEDEMAQVDFRPCGRVNERGSVFLNRRV